MTETLTSPSIPRAAFLTLARRELLLPHLLKPSPPTPIAVDTHAPWPKPALEAPFGVQTKLMHARRALQASEEARDELQSHAGRAEVIWDLVGSNLKTGTRGCQEREREARARVRRDEGQGRRARA